MIRVELFRTAHLPRILEIERRSFPREAYSEEIFRELHRDCGDLFFVARRARRVIGYMVTSVAGAKAEVVSIAVDPEHRHHGAASALMAHTLARLKPSTVYLTVRPENTSAVAFYRSFGFTRVRLVKGYYEDHGDGMRMRKTL